MGDGKTRVPRWAQHREPDEPASPQPEGKGAGERLQKILAQAGVASRRAAEELIAAGRVTVNGKPVTEMGSRANPATDVIAVDGRPLKAKDGTGEVQRLVYIALHKPIGVVSTARDPYGRPTVLSLLAGAKLVEQGLRVYPVGRLDADSSGLVLLTNDGDLTFRLTHPRFGVEKEYRVLMRGRVSEDKLQRLRDGVEIEGGLTAPAKVDVSSTREGNTWLRMTIKEGRKRQVRLMAAAVGHPVIELQRIRFGSIDLGTLEPGKWRNLAIHEVHALRKLVRLKPEEGAPIAKADHSVVAPPARHRTSSGPRPSRPGFRSRSTDQSPARGTSRTQSPGPRPQPPHSRSSAPGSRPGPHSADRRPAGSRPAPLSDRPRNTTVPTSPPSSHRTSVSGPRPQRRPAPPSDRPRSTGYSDGPRNVTRTTSGGVSRGPGSAGRTRPGGSPTRRPGSAPFRPGSAPFRPRPSGPPREGAGFSSGPPRRPGRPVGRPPLGRPVGRPPVGRSSGIGQGRPPVRRTGRPAGASDGQRGRPSRPSVRRFPTSKRRDG